MRKVVLVAAVAAAVLVPTAVAAGPGAGPDLPGVAGVAGVAGPGVPAAVTGAAAPAAAPAARGADRAPVPPRLTTLAVPPVRARSAAPVVVRRPTTARFAALGATWAADPAVGTVAVEFRTRVGTGPWTAWSTTESDDKEPDAPRGTRGGTEPVWTGPATGVEARVTARTGAAPRDVRLTLVDPGTDPVDATVTAAPATVVKRPPIHTRAQWGADPALMTWTPEYAPRLAAGFLHHTVGTNDYAAADVPAILRSIYAFHAQTRGWGDIGYHVLVDRFGRSWEGRAGGLDSTVVGAHAGGFNTGTVGVAMIGDFRTAAVPAITTSAVASVFAWKLARWGLDPTGTARLTSAGGGTSRYPAGTVVTKPVISGHRDVGTTECPGDRGYALLGLLRTRVKAAVGTGAVLLEPAAAPTTVAFGAADGPRVTARLGGGATAWTATVTRDCPTAAVRTWSGTGAVVDTGWDLTDGAGRRVRPGTYTLRLFPAPSATGTAWSTRITLLPPTAAPAEPTGTPPAAGPAGLVPVPPVRVLDTRTGSPLGGAARRDVRVTGVGGVPATGVSAVVLSANGTCGTAAGPLTLWPAGTARPGTDAVSVRPGAGTDSALTVVGVGVDGRVSVAGGSGSVDAILDLVGYLPTGGGPGLRPVATRVLDATLAAGATRQLTVPGGTAASAVLVNVSVVAPAAAGTVSVWPAGRAKPATAAARYAAGPTTAKRVLTAVAGGRVSVSNSGPAAVRVLVDVTAWYGGAGPAFTAVTPARVATVTLPAGGPGTAVRVAGAPAGARAVVASLTARAAARTWLVAWGSGAKPPTSDLQVPANTAATTLVVLPLAADGTIRLSSGGAPATASLDVIGYYA